MKLYRGKTGDKHLRNNHKKIKIYMNQLLLNSVLISNKGIENINLQRKLSVYGEPTIAVATWVLEIETIARVLKT